MSTDRITANLPSRDFDVTEAFYARLGFIRQWRDETWMILTRGPFEIEFFPHPDLEPEQSWFSACLRARDFLGLHEEWRGLGLAESGETLPRISARITDFGGDVPRMFFLHDPDGSLWRVMETGDNG